MTRFVGALAFGALLSTALSVPVSAQGISEYAAAHGAAATTAAAAHRSAGATSGATQNLYGSAAGALNSITGGSPPAANSSSNSGHVNSVNQLAAKGMPDDLSPLFKEKLDAAGNPIPIDPRVTVLTVGKMSNKFFAEAQAKEKAGKLNEAEVLYMRAIRLRNRFWGDNDPAVLRMYMLVGKLEMKLKRPDSAENFYKRALQICLKRYGFGSYENVEYLSAMGDALYAQQHYSDAANYYKQVKQLEERKSGPAGTKAISASVRLANSMAHDSDTRLPDADALLKATLPLAEKVPNNNAQMIGLLDAYQFVLAKENKTAEAEAMAARLTALRAPAVPVAPPADAPVSPAAAAPPGGTPVATPSVTSTSTTSTSTTSKSASSSASTTGATTTATSAKTTTETTKDTAATSTAHVPVVAPGDKKIDTK